MWILLGLAGAAGASINYFIALAFYRRKMARRREAGAGSEAYLEETSTPENWREAVLFGFRELTRADFCFIVLVLALIDGLWVLAPAGATGAQAYWIAQLFTAKKNYRV